MMKRSIYFCLLAAYAISCQPNKTQSPTCYLSSELINGTQHNYYYNSKMQLTSDVYPGDNAVITYDDSGKVIGEQDDPDISISYTYNNKNQLIQMNAVSASNPVYYNWQAKYQYNSASQLTYEEIWLYSTDSSKLYMDHYQLISYNSSNTKNYSVRKRYDRLGNLVWTNEYTWDTHPNPHLKNPYFFNEMPPSNNITSIAYTPAGGTTLTTNYDYTYNSNGYPVIQSVSGTPVNIYHYENCD